MRKYCTKTRRKPSMENTKPCSPRLVPGVLVSSFRSFAAWSTHLSLELFPLPIFRSLWLMSRGSGIPRILGSPQKPRIHSSNFKQWLLSGWHCKNSFPIHFLASVALWNCKNVQEPLTPAASKPSKPIPLGRYCQVPLLVWGGPQPS